MPRRPDPDDLAKARFMALNRKPISAAATRLCETINTKAARWETERGGRKSNRGKTQAALQHAVGAIVADVVSAGERWVYRPLSAARFNDCPVSYRLFVAARDALLGLRLLDKAPGYHSRAGKGPGRTSRFRATPRLLAMAQEAGLGDPSGHFTTDLPANPIVLRAGSRRIGGDKAAGAMMRYSATATTRRMTAEVRELDEFIRDHHPLTRGEHRGFIRIFSPCDDPATYRWNTHGRLYSVGGASYQQMPKRDRAQMRLGGKPVVEIDIGASHLSIYSAMRGQPINHRRDPYVIPQFSREVIKGWIVAALGHGRFHRRWPADLAKRIKERGLVLPPIADVQAAVLRRHPVLAQWPDDKRVNVHVLMNVESEIIVATLLRLKREHGIPALPVHDSIIVPKNAEKIARRALMAEFREVAGATPRLSG